MSPEQGQKAYAIQQVPMPVLSRDGVCDWPAGIVLGVNKKECWICLSCESCVNGFPFAVTFKVA